MADVKFNDRVAIITGAGAGLGKAYALALAKRGVRIVANDLTAPDGVAEEIAAAGGEALAYGANVANPDAVGAMVEAALNRFGKIDILVNNAGILRDKSFAKMEPDDFHNVVDVHLNGSAICTMAVWGHMREQGYGRVVMTTSASGMYGNFGQANYGAAKAGLTGLARTLSLEGAKYDIRVNTICPVAATQMTEDVMPAEILESFSVDAVAPALVYLVCDDAPNRITLAAGAGGYAAIKIMETEGVALPPDRQTAEGVAENFDRILDAQNISEFEMGFKQAEKFIVQTAGGS